MSLKIGKLTNESLKANILDSIKKTRSDVLLSAGIGEDTAAIDFGEEACVLSMDPVTGTDTQTGSIAVHVSCNDVASSGAEPVGILVTLLAPPNVDIDDIRKVMKDVTESAAKINVDVIGGHTEVTDAVNRIVVVSTVIGRVKKDRLISSGGSKPGDSIVMTKWAGIEGTSIIASDLRDEIVRAFGEDFTDKAAEMKKYISVVSESLVASDTCTIHAMHDITEGGLLGAVWELAEAAGLGVKIFLDKVIIKEETQKICKLLNIDPLKLISSGSLLISCSGNDAEMLVSRLNDSGISASIIGNITIGHAKIGVDETGAEKEILPPESDEIYKVFR